MHAHAHLGGVGFFVLMIVAVSYKLVPMFTLSDLQNERRAGAAIGLINLGLAGLFVTMALRSPWKLGAALVIVAGLVAYAVEILAILRARKRRVLDWGLRHFLTALGLLGLVTVLGLVLCWPGLPVTLLTTQLETVYGWLGLAGVVTLTVLGFLYKIVPFQIWYHRYARHVGRSRVPSLADLYSGRLQVAGFGLVLAGLLATAVGAALGHETVTRGGVLILLGGLTAFTVNLALMFRHFWRPRLEPLAGPAPAPATPSRNS
jgi:hypothetical protein